MAGLIADQALSDPFLFALLNDFQRGFPTCSEPFDVLGQALGRTGAEVVQGFRSLRDAGLIDRIGPLFVPRRVGASTLAALAVPEDELDVAAAIVSDYAEVNHNYERVHRFNLWFVVTAPNALAMQRVLDRIAEQTGHVPISLPLLREYHIDLGFDLRTGEKVPNASNIVAIHPENTLDEDERQLVAALQFGLALMRRPYANLAAKLGREETWVRTRIERWLGQGILRRFGVVVRHRALGYSSNAMCVWDVPDEHVRALGGALAREPGVTLCYERKRVPGLWRYNLFCMIHGRRREDVVLRLDAISGELGLDGLDSAVLFSRRCFKQSGARYARASSAAA